MSERKEIGGYFEFEQLISKEYYSDLIAVNNARCALLYIIKAKHYRKVYLPYFLCDSVKLMLEREHIPYEEYRIDRMLLPQFERNLKSDEVLYLVNYYGYLSDSKILEMKELYGNIVIDNAQAFFAKPVTGIDTLYSCRKFFGVPDGGYVYTDAVLNETIPEDISKDRMRHLLGRFEGRSASDYYADFCNNDESFKTMGLRRMSKLTHNILGAVDYDKVKQRREENYRILSDALGEMNRLKIQSPPGPYAYPFYMENGMKTKKALAKEKIYVATLWPNALNTGLDTEIDLAENILPLPCDQRYSEEDMERVINTLLKIRDCSGLSC